MATFNFNVPSFDEADDAKMRRQIRDHLKKLNEQLQYTLSNLGADNFTPEFNTILNSIVSNEAFQSQIKQTAEQIALKVTQSSYDGEKVYIGTTAPADPTAGMKWIDTSVSPALLRYWDATLETPAWVAAGADTVNAVSVLINVVDGLKITQQLSGQTVYTYFKANATHFGLYLLADDTPIAEAGVDSDGKGYFAVSRLKDPQASSDMHVGVFSETSPIPVVGIQFLQKLIDGTYYLGGQVGYESDAEASSGMFVKHNWAKVYVGYGDATGLSLSTGYGAAIGGDVAAIRLLGGTESTPDGIDIEMEEYAAPVDEAAPEVIDFDGRPRIMLRNRERDAEDNVIAGRCIRFSVSDLGTTATIRIGARSLGGTLDRPVVDIGASVLPAENSTYSLGSNVDTKRWGTVFLVNAPNVSSDARLKRDISDIDNVRALILNLKPKQYRLKSEPDDAPLHMGFLHHEVVEALELAGKGAMAAAHVGDDGMGSLVYEEFIAAQTAMIQAQHQQIAALMARVEALEAR